MIFVAAFYLVGAHVYARYAFINLWRFREFEKFLPSFRDIMANYNLNVNFVTAVAIYIKVLDVECV